MEIFNAVQTSLDLMNENLNNEYQNVKLDDALSTEKLINEIQNRLKQDQLNSVKEGKYNYNTGIIFLELITQAEKLGDLVINVSEAIYHASD